MQRDGDDLAAKAQEVAQSLPGRAEGGKDSQSDGPEVRRVQGSCARRGGAGEGVWGVAQAGERGRRAEVSKGARKEPSAGARILAQEFEDDFTLQSVCQSQVLLLQLTTWVTH